MTQEELAEATNVLHALLPVNVASEQQIEIRGNLVGRALASCKVAVCRAGLTGYVMRAARLHFVIAAAKFPAMHDALLTQVPRGLRQERDLSKRAQRHEPTSSETWGSLCMRPEAQR